MSAVVFAGLLFLAGKSIAPGNAGVFAAAVLIPSLMQLAIRRFAFVDTPLTTLYALAAAPVVAYVLGTAWTVMTYFVVPVLVVEKLGPFAAIGRSVSILKKTWGEALVGKMGLGFFLFLLALPGIALIIFGAYVLVAGYGPIGVGLILAGVVWLLLESAVGAALQGIFVGALYQYAAHGVVPEGFDANAMRSTFGAKESGRD